MSVKLQPAFWTLPEAVLADLTRKGFHLFDAPLDPQACGDLSRRLRGRRPMDERLFLAEGEVAAADGLCAAPCAASRLADAPIAALRRAPQISEALWTLLGPDHRLLRREVVCHLPLGALPGWVRRRVQAGAAGDLTRFVRPQYRDMTYVCEEAYGQDACAVSTVSLSVQLDPVAAEQGPVTLLEGSHRMGAIAAAPELARTGQGAWRYRRGLHDEMHVIERALTGEAGLAVLWHGCTLHGAKAAGAGDAWLALRWRFGRGGAQHVGIDAIDASLAGPAHLPG